MEALQILHPFRGRCWCEVFVESLLSVTSYWSYEFELHLCAFWKDSSQSLYCLRHGILRVCDYLHCSCNWACHIGKIDRFDFPTNNDVVDRQDLADYVGDDDVVLVGFDGVQYCRNRFHFFVQYALQVSFPSFAVSTCPLNSFWFHFFLRSSSFSFVSVFAFVLSVFLFLFLVASIWCFSHRTSNQFPKSNYAYQGRRSWVHTCMRSTAFFLHAVLRVLYQLFNNMNLLSIRLHIIVHTLFWKYRIRIPGVMRAFFGSITETFVTFPFLFFLKLFVCSRSFVFQVAA